LKTLTSIFILALAFQAASAQERVTIKDPEIEFSFELPKKWVTQNDDFYFYVFNPDWSNTQLAITYFNMNTPRELEEIVDTRKKFSYIEIEGYSYIDTKNLEIDGVTAYSVEYNSKSEDVKLANKEYIFVKEGQVFYLLFTTERRLYDERVAPFESLVKSFRCSYL